MLQSDLLRAVLVERGFSINHLSAGATTRVTCPECTPTRSLAGQRRKDCAITVDKDGAGARWHCHHCGASDGLRLSDAAHAKPKANGHDASRHFAPPDLDGPCGAEVVAYLAARRISVSTAGAAGIGADLRCFDGPARPAVAFCYRATADGAIVGIKYRTTDPTAAKENRIRSAPGSTFPHLWGLDRLDPALGVAVLSEGEVDALSFAEAGIANAVSIPHGASEKPQGPFEWLAPLDGLRVTVALDNDETGRGMRRALLQALGWHRCEIIDFPDGVKDANDYLRAHGRAKLAELHVGARPAIAADAEDEPRASAADEPPDLSVLRLHRRPPPELPLDAFGECWARWIGDAAIAAASPVDYVAAPLLATTSALIGNARWAQATAGWAEPPHIWAASVGDSGQCKSAGADAIYRHVIPAMERRMAADFPDRLREWQARAEIAKARREQWQSDLRTAQKKGAVPPLPPPDLTDEPEPLAPRLVQSDVTIEKVALLLAAAAPKGFLIVRDELAGWLFGMDAYTSGARQFWVEAYGGRPYRVDRVKHPKPISVPRLAVACHGSIQPARLAELMREADDGLLARFCWFWPEPVRFRLGTEVPDLDFAITAFDRFRMLELAPPREAGEADQPMMVALAPAARAHLEALGQEMQDRQETAGGLLVSALGKARGLALRLSLLVEFLWWAAEPGITAAPTHISERAFLAAAALVGGYFMPMAERVYGDAAATAQERNAATLARWIAKARPAAVDVRRLQRAVRLPGLREGAAIHEACKGLIEAGWLALPASGGAVGRPRAVYDVRPALWAALP